MAKQPKKPDQPDKPWGLGGPDLRLVPKQEFFRIHLEAPPQSSPVEGAKPPFCPMMQQSVNVPRQGQSVIIAGREATQMEVQVVGVALPCLRENCLFWDRLDGRCGITSLLDMLLGGDEGDEKEGGPEDEGPQGAPPPAQAPLSDTGGR